MASGKTNLALVLAGGGARGAYEAGVIHYIRTQLPPEISRKRRFDILCGSSVGAINTCFLAATSHDLTYQANKIYEVWCNIRQEDVYKRDVLSLANFVSRSVIGISKNFFSRTSTHPDSHQHRKHFKGLLNTAPFIPFLKKIIPWNQISLNIKNGLLSAVSVTATNAATGKLELFIEKHPDVRYTGHYIHHDTKLEYSHAMASGAIPIIFPTIRINRNHYMDGSLRLNTPMSPAIQLGAEKILVIGLHHQGERSESSEKDGTKPFIEADVPPSLGLLLGRILSSIFLDRLDYDIQQLNRINRVVEWAEGCYGADFVPRINSYLKERGITGDVANRGLKKLKALRINPSRDLRDVFAETVDSTRIFSKSLSSLEKLLLKVLDVDLYSGRDFLSFILFHPEYIKRLLELGFEDARRYHDELVTFMSD